MGLNASSLVLVCVTLTTSGVSIRKRRYDIVSVTAKTYTVKVNEVRTKQVKKQDLGRDKSIIRTDLLGTMDCVFWSLPEHVGRTLLGTLNGFKGQAVERAKTALKMDQVITEHLRETP
jgi:hypothetical protein